MCIIREAITEGLLTLVGSMGESKRLGCQIREPMSGNLNGLANLCLGDVLGKVAGRQNVVFSNIYSVLKSVALSGRGQIAIEIF